MHVSERTVYRYAEWFRVTADVRPSVKRNGPAQLLCEFEELLLIQLILAHPGIYLRELQQLLYHSTSCWVDASTVCRTVHRLGMTRQCVFLQRSEVKRVEFWAEISAFEPSMMFWEMRFESMAMASEDTPPKNTPWSSEASVILQLGFFPLKEWKMSISQMVLWMVTNS